MYLRLGTLPTKKGLKERAPITGKPRQPMSWLDRILFVAENVSLARSRRTSLRITESMRLQGGDLKVSSCSASTLREMGPALPVEVGRSEKNDDP